jgi:hypothetical protein
VSTPTLLKQPSAWLPLAMSMGALIVLAVALGIRGLDRAPQPDEGAAAHLWQLLMGGQLPIIAWFAIRWLPEAPRAALAVLGLQLAAGLAAAAPVFLLGL